MKIRWTRAATRDLRAAEAYIAEDSPYFAREFTARLLDSTRKLAEHPRIGRAVPEIGSPDICELIVLRYRVVYALQADAVIVLAVLHGSRDLSALPLPRGD